MQVADLVRYNHVVRGLYFDALAKLPWAAVVEPRGLSFDSMRNTRANKYPKMMPQSVTHLLRKHHKI